MKHRLSISNLTIAATLIIMIAVSSNINWGGDRWVDIIESDAKGYYAYLPAIFIYHDLNFGFFDKIEKGEYYNKNLYYDYRANGNGKTIDKYYSGTALAQMPFFLMAHALSYLTDTKPDGYSRWYHIFINIAAIFYLVLGLYFINQSLAGYDIKDSTRSIVLITITFGTNLFYYTVCEPGMSHIYSFAFFALFFYFARQWFLTLQAGYIPKALLVLGLICLIRPVNGLILLALPFAAGTWENFRKGVLLAWKYPGYTTAGMLLFISFASLQMIIYKVSADVFFIDSYQGERFNFLDPHFFAILFSYKKGLFLYTPVYLLSFTGCYYLYKESRFACYAWLLFFTLITYIFSSWWCWYYGGSFSGRVYVEYLPLFAILLAVALDRIKNGVYRKTFIGIMITLTILCQIQIFQYRYYHIHWSEMTKEKYWEVFLRIDKLL